MKSKSILQSARIRPHGLAASVSAWAYFTKGQCAELADAIAEKIDGSTVVEVRMPTPSGSLLVHCAATIDGAAIDIEGRTSLDEWLRKWKIGSTLTVSFRRRLPEFLAFADNRSAKIARQFAKALLSQWHQAAAKSVA